MPEAEDVILHAAECATTVARSLWLRHRPPGRISWRLPGDGPVGASRSYRRHVSAGNGHSTPSDPSPPPTWLAKRWEKPTAIDYSPRRRSLYRRRADLLPRRLHLFEDEDRDYDLLRLIALMLGARLGAGDGGHMSVAAIGARSVLGRR